VPPNFYATAELFEHKILSYKQELEVEMTIKKITMKITAL